MHFKDSVFAPFHPCSPTSDASHPQCHFRGLTPPPPLWSLPSKLRLDLDDVCLTASLPASPISPLWTAGAPGCLCYSHKPCESIMTLTSHWTGKQPASLPPLPSPRPPICPTCARPLTLQMIQAFPFQCPRFFGRSSSPSQLLLDCVGADPLAHALKL